MWQAVARAVLVVSVSGRDDVEAVAQALCVQEGLDEDDAGTWMTPAAVVAAAARPGRRRCARAARATGAPLASVAETAAGRTRMSARVQGRTQCPV